MNCHHYQIDIRKEGFGNCNSSWGDLMNPRHILYIREDKCGGVSLHVRPRETKSTTSIPTGKKWNPKREKYKLV